MSTHPAFSARATGNHAHQRTWSPQFVSSTCFLNYNFWYIVLVNISDKINFTFLHKKSSRHVPNNYRPVPLTCILCKLLEHIISSHIHLFLEQNQLLNDSQHGFRSGRPCETQLVYTFNDLAYNLEQGLVTDIIILDFCQGIRHSEPWKAFNKIEKLWHRYAIN